MFTSARLSPSIAISSLALFVSLGGTGYALSTIKGSSIVKNSIPGNRIQSNSLTGTQIKESGLTIVPSATHAVTADHATNADHATAADGATNASHATTADSATNAGHATSADSATAAGHATTADSAASATSATNAVNATNAATAAALTGFNFDTIRYTQSIGVQASTVILNDFDGLTLTAQCTNGLTLTAQSATAGSAIGIEEIHGTGNGNAAEFDQPNLTSNAAGAVIMGSAPGVPSTGDETGEIVFQQADPGAQAKGGTVTIDYLYTFSNVSGCGFEANAIGHPGT